MKLEDGKEIEVFTAAEQQAAVQAKETEIGTLKGELEGFKGKDQNFSALKTKLEGLEGELKTYKETTTAAEAKRILDTKETIIKRLSGGNIVLEEKIKKEYDGFAGIASTEGEILERAKKSLYVAAPAEAPGAIDVFQTMTGGRGAPIIKTVPGEVPVETPEQAEVRRKMGISDEDYKKYGARASASNKK